ncbi:MAG TPA: hypothetical protein DCL35_06155 [Candidatus Omnitrophica bacterium]|nr:hypothetical protein [Candidatus Omnitrophota bacterium]
MKKRKLVILTVVFILLASLALGIYYVNKAVLPTIVKEKIIIGLSELTSTKVTLDALSFNLFRGVVISNLVFSDKDEPNKILCSIKDASAGFLIIGFIKEKKIIIPSLNLNALEFNLVRQKDGLLSIAPLIEKLTRSAPSGGTPSILVKAVNVSDSAIRFTDLTFDPPVAAVLDIGRLNLSLYWQKASAVCEASITKDNKEAGFKIKASYSYASQNWDAEITAGQIDALILKEYILGLPASLDSAQITGLKIKCASDKNIAKAEGAFNFGSLDARQGDISLKDMAGSIGFSAETPLNDLKKITARGKLAVESGSLSYSNAARADGKIDRSSCDYAVTPDNIGLSVNLSLSAINAEINKIKLKNGSIQTKAKITMPLYRNENAGIALAYSGTADARADEISGLEQIGVVSSVEAGLQFKNNDISIQKLLLIALDTQVSGTGSLKDNILNLDIEGDFDLEELSKLLPKDTSIPDIEISGTTEVKARVTSDMSKDRPPAFKGEATLQNVSLELPEGNVTIEADAGRLLFDTAAEGLQWHFSSVKYLGLAYSFDGDLKNFKTPEITAVIIGADIRAKAEIIKKQNMLMVTSAEGSYKNSRFTLSGNFDGKENLVVSGMINLDTEDLIYLLPRNKAALEQIGLKGKCVIRADASGPLKDWRLWNINAKGNSGQISCYGLKLKNIIAEYSQKQQQGFLDLLSFDAYRGKGVVKGRLGFSGSDIDYTLRGLLNNIDLGALRMDTPLKEKNFYGLLDLNISAKGRGAELNTITGVGSFTIREGNIWEFNPLQGLGNFIFSPGFNRIAFTDAQADFSIQNGYIATDNLELLGPQLGLICEGKVGFDGKLDLLVNTQIPATKNGKIGDVISRAGSLTAIKITGTAKEPKYKLQPIGENILRKVGEIFSNILP